MRRGGGWFRSSSSRDRSAAVHAPAREACEPGTEGKYQQTDECRSARTGTGRGQDRSGTRLLHRESKRGVFSGCRRTVSAGQSVSRTAANRPERRRPRDGRAMTRVSASYSRDAVPSLVGAGEQGSSKLAPPFGGSARRTGSDARGARPSSGADLYVSVLRLRWRRRAHHDRRRRRDLE
jgi:hypothetical protein